MLLRPHPFTLRQLQYVIAVADALSFRKAALRCRVSQPALSAQVAAAEDALGLVIFERTRRRVMLTPAGERLVAQARAVLRETDDLVGLAEQTRDPLAGTLRLGVIPTLSPYLLPAVTPALRLAFPRLSSVWVEGHTETLVARLGEGELDAAVLALEADLGALDHAVIARDEFVLATPRAHPLGRSLLPAEPGELQGSDVLLLDDGHCFRDQALAVCSGAGAHELGFRATSLSTLVQMVAAGLGVTLLPRCSLPIEASRAALSVRPFASPAPYRTVALVWRPGAPLAPAYRKLAEVLRQTWPAASELPTQQAGVS